MSQLDKSKEDDASSPILISGQYSAAMSPMNPKDQIPNQKFRDKF